MWEAHLGYSCARTDRRVLCRWMGPSMFSLACLGAYPCRQQQAFRLQTCLLFHIVIKLLSTAPLPPPLPVLLTLCLCLLVAHCCMADSGQRALGEFPASWGGAGCLGVFRECSSRSRIRKAFISNARFGDNDHLFCNSFGYVRGVIGFKSEPLQAVLPN